MMQGPFLELYAAVQLEELDRRRSPEQVIPCRAPRLSQWLAKLLVRLAIRLEGAGARGSWTRGAALLDRGS
jgi:hypothetical protein